MVRLEEHNLITSRGMALLLILCRLRGLGGLFLRFLFSLLQSLGEGPIVLGRLPLLFFFGLFVHIVFVIILRINLIRILIILIIIRFNLILNLIYSFISWFISWFWGFLLAILALKAPVI